jgi:hypothetical protein
MIWRDYYSDYRFVAGLLLLLLGIGNWTVGAIEISKYQALLHRTAQTGLEENYHTFQQLDYQKNEEVLRRITEDREKYNAARVKLDFYYVVVTGGQLFFVIGLLLTSLAVLRVTRRSGPSAAGETNPQPANRPAGT